MKAEALPPDLLQDIVRVAIEAEIDSEALQRTLDHQEEVRSHLSSSLEGLS